MNTKEKETLKYRFRGLCNAILTLVIALFFAYAWEKRLNDMQTVRYMEKGNWLMIAVYTALVIAFINMYKGYNVGVSKISATIISQALAIIMVNTVEIALTILVVGSVYYVSSIIIVFVELSVVQVIFAAFFTWFIVSMYRKIFPPLQLLMISGEHQNDLASKMNSRDDKYYISREISASIPFEEMNQEIDKYDAVILNDVPSQVKNRILKVCYDKAKRVYFTPKISDIIVKASDDLYLFDSPLYLCRNMGLSFPQRLIKRAGDIVLSLIGLIITSPILLVTALVIKLYDGGSVFFEQERCTQGGKIFKILKFRSMVEDADKYGVNPTTANDNRITPIGKIIRATRIDELPQLINILKGDMSLVGPRPERIEHVEEYCKEVPEFSYRLAVKGGLTGYAQIYGKYNTTAYDKLKLDLIYIENYSIWLDLQIILLTLRTILTPESTEGFSDEKSREMRENMNRKK